MDRGWKLKAGLHFLRFAMRWYKLPGVKLLLGRAVMIVIAAGPVQINLLRFLATWEAVCEDL